MRFFNLAFAHVRMAARQRALWVASFALALAAASLSAGTGLAFQSDKVSDLTFLAQMLAMLPPVAYAAAFTDLAVEPERLHLSEVEASAPVGAVELAAARVLGSLSVMVLPSATVLAIAACGQTLHGNVWAVPQSVVLLAIVVVPAALLAAALSALAGAVLPRAVARIAAVVSWCVVLFAVSFVGVPSAGGATQFHLVSDPVCQAFFASPPFLDYLGSGVAATPVMAVASIALKLAAAAGLLAAAGAVARKRSCKRG